MNIFNKRPLSLILCVMLGAFVFFSKSSALIRISMLCIATVCFIVSFLKVPNLNKTLIRFAAIFGIVAMLLSAFYFDFVFSPENRYNGEVKIEATVTDVVENDYRITFTLEKCDINSSYTSQKLLAYSPKNEAPALEVGDIISFDAEIHSFTSSEEFDAEGYYTAKGISGYVEELNSLKVISSDNITSSIVLARLRHAITDYIVGFSNEKIGGFLSALLIGDRDGLSNVIFTDFRRLGISHVLALSGMHLAIFTMGLRRILTFFRLNKKAVSVSAIAFTLLYMALAGFSSSVARAGIMLIITNALFLLAETHDSITTLSISVFIIVLIEPFSIYDLGLWLSAFATLGICTFNEIDAQNERKSGFGRWIFASTVSSVFAIISTLFISISRFGEFSLLGIPATIIFGILSEIFLYLGIASVLLGWILPVGVVLVPFGDFIAWLASVMADIDLASFSTNFIPTRIIAIILTVLSVVFVAFNIKHKKSFVIALAVLLCAFYITGTAITVSVQNESKLVYHNESGEAFICADEGVVSVTNASVLTNRNTFALLSALKDEGYVMIDKYIFTHYHKSIDTSLETLLSRIKICEVVLPLPQNDSETVIYRQIKELCDAFRVKLTTNSSGEVIKIGDYTLSVWHNSPLDEEEKLLFTFLAEGKYYTYLTNAMFYGKTKSMTHEIIGGSHTIIFGRHAQSNELKFTYKIGSVERLVFSGKNVYLPNDTRDFYKEDKLFYGERRINLIR